MKKHEHAVVSAAGEAELFRFRGFSLDRGQRRLLGPDGKVVPLTARAFDTLSHLVEHPNELIEKQALMKAVWPNTIVEENNLNQNISIVRRALGETPGEHRFVVTVPGRGFWFVATVTRGSAPSAPRPLPLEPRDAACEPEPRAPAELPALRETIPNPREQPLPTAATRTRAKPVARWIGIGLAAGMFLVLTSYFLVHHFNQASASATALSSSTASVDRAEPSLAVLPFLNMSADKDQEYFADGLTEELSIALARLDGLRVVGRTSAFAFKGKNEDLRLIGTTLGVDHLLEGSVRKVGNELRITAELVDAKSGSRVWSDVYERTLDDIFSIQEEIAKAVANALSVKLRSGGELGTRNAAAYDAYLAGIADLRHLVSGQYLRGIQELEHAVSLDPTFVRAWSYLADAYGDAVGTLPGSDTEYLQKSRAAWSRALALAPDSPELLMGAGIGSLTAARNWQALERMGIKCLAKSGSEYGPNYMMAMLLRNVGRPHDSLQYQKRAARAEPLVLNASVQLQDVYLTLGDAKSAETEYQRSKPFGDNSAYADYERLLAAGTDRHDPILVKQYLQQHPPQSPVDKMMEGLGEPADALVLLRRRYQEPIVEDNAMIQANLAQFAAFYGDPELALQFLRKSYRRTNNYFFMWHPVYKEMRRLPAFKELVRELRLVDYWRASGNWGEFCHPAGADDFECS